MRCKFIGAKYLDFLDDNGKPVKGWKLILTTPDPDFIGNGVTLPFVSVGTELHDKLSNEIRSLVNQIVEVDYFPNSKGKSKLYDIRLAKQ